MAVAVAEVAAAAELEAGGAGGGRRRRSWRRRWRRWDRRCRSKGRHKRPVEPARDRATEGDSEGGTVAAPALEEEAGSRRGRVCPLARGGRDAFLGWAENPVRALDTAWADDAYVEERRTAGNHCRLG